jgi:hypothetical protein
MTLLPLGGEHRRVWIQQRAGVNGLRSIDPGQARVVCPSLEWSDS